MYVIGAGALTDFAASYPGAAPALRALAARLQTEAFASADALAAALGPNAKVQAGAVTLDLAASGARVRLAFDAAAQLVIVTAVEKLKP
jgi:mRNA-degrading endonuclease HigB of HigAB toxin-antitoxin module